MDKHKRLEAARVRAGHKSASAAARAIGAKVSTYISHENGHRDYDGAAASYYARRLKVSAAWLMFGEGEIDDAPEDTSETDGGGMIVRGDVRAGAWMEIDGDAPSLGTVPMSTDPLFAAPQFALRVVGTSMNKVALPGQYVIVASWPELGLELRDGDLVVVRRERAMTYEVTLKRARRGEKGWELWPESTDPKYQEPVALEDGNRDVEVTIVGKVIGKYERL